MDFNLSDPVSFDWFILALRIAFIGLIYYFLYRISRESIRELIAVGVSAPSTASPVLPTASSSLEIVDPAEARYSPGETLQLAHYTTIGRRPDNSLVINDSYISGTHAELVFDNGDWWVIDLGSTNGTFVNGSPIQARTRVGDGDIVQFGRVTTRMHT
jgi:hypothetical protein